MGNIRSGRRGDGQRGGLLPGVQRVPVFAAGTARPPVAGQGVDRSGGIPIDRSASHGMVDTMINQYKSMDKFILAIAPEGTRKKVEKWKSGFYRIAMGADVPILMACFDYENKIISFGPLIYPSGNLSADIEEMQLVFENIRGKKSQ